jgi:ABC-type phosphate transport system substrate-binding protein
MRPPATRPASIVTLLLAIVLAVAAAGCGDEEPRPIDTPSPPPVVAASIPPIATPAEETVVLIDASVELTELLATIESAYEIGHPAVDLEIALHDTPEMQARLFDDQPADIFLVDVAMGTARSATAASTRDPLAFSEEYVALLADRSGVAGPVLSFLSWLMGPEGRAIVTSVGLTPPAN